MLNKYAVCENCVLPFNFPNTRISDDGICNHCRTFVPERIEKAKERYKKKFIDLLNSLDTQYHNGEKGVKVAVAYSGGKDSTYTVWLLKEVYGLDVVTFTFDNHFISPQAWNNIKTVTDNLDIESVICQIEANELFHLFRGALRTELYSKKSLERASTLCTTCSGIFKAFVLTFALENNIPLIGYGWSPGQAPVSAAIAQIMPSFVESARNVMVDAIKTVSPIIAEDITLTNEEKILLERREIYNIHPLAYEDYNETFIKAHIKTLGWKEPEDVDTNSTNCRLNCLANYHHIRKYGFHPYVWEVANMVRQGVMPREEGMTKIYNKSNDNVTEIMEELDATDIFYTV